MGFESVHTSLDLSYTGARYHLVHDAEDAPAGVDAVLCGHDHDRYPSPLLPDLTRPTINVGVDVWDFCPVSLNTISLFVEAPLQGLRDLADTTIPCPPEFAQVYDDNFWSLL